MRLRYFIICTLFAAATPAFGEVGIGIGLPGISIGINIPFYPELVPVPGYPVYYAPQQDSNLFFYDGLYWVYADDQWFASEWYNGPWQAMAPDIVPLFVLRVPVRYYRRPPSYFRGWGAESAPHWGEHWGRGWSQRRSGWDHWNRGSMPALAPLPTYQRAYAGEGYPGREQQQSLRGQNYAYRPHDAAVRSKFESQPRNSLSKMFGDRGAGPATPPTTNRSGAPARTTVPGDRPSPASQPHARDESRDRTAGQARRPDPVSREPTSSRQGAPDVARSSRAEHGASAAPSQAQRAQPPSDSASRQPQHQAAPSSEPKQERNREAEPSRNH